MPVNDSDLITQGLILMVVGMSVVFVFLGIMIGVMNTTAKVLKLISKYFPEEIKIKDKLEKAIEQNDEVAVVLAAVNAYIKG
ncbi:MAG: hypothetical protein A2287_09410 [Candidatus Melainabacteria bacterium RIFOXYA12_FULL_32_12]|nr:MAG: hypothetical protein A2255_07490 [Candidatus Melainabacteria bacterium RIFOXYA2_FULL_32_9]OGI31218.1 MAG: hypothetical protein A2287_09410 [Candidatus Melainabacteria bacterium RIFOXYA12_FULL_32_12]